MRRTHWWICVSGLTVASVAVTFLGAQRLIAKDRPAPTVDGPSERSAMLNLTQIDIPKLFSYDYQTVERSLLDSYPLLTPDYRREFQKSANAQIIPEAKRRQVV